MHAFLTDSASTAPLEPVQQATGAFSLIWVLVALPVLGAIVLLAGGRRTNRWGPVLGVLLVWGAFAVAAVQFVTMLGEPSNERSHEQTLWTWVSSGLFPSQEGGNEQRG